MYPSSLYKVDSFQELFINVHVLLKLPRVVVQPARLQVQFREQLGRVIVHFGLGHLKL